MERIVFFSILQSSPPPFGPTDLVAKEELGIAVRNNCGSYEKSKK
jgi:hypothetical protein